MQHYRLLFLFLLLSCGMQSMAQFEGEKQIYFAKNMKNTIANHKTVAILPFRVSITYRHPPKGFDMAANKIDEEKSSLNLQGGLYTYLLRKADHYTVAFQDVERTNILLKQANVMQKLDVMLPDSLAKILGVDAVIVCRYYYEKTATEAGALVGTFLLGGMGAKTGSGSLSMQIYNGTNGELLWRFFKGMNENLASSGNEVMERMMRKVSRNFPYER